MGMSFEFPPYGGVQWILKFIVFHRLFLRNLGKTPQNLEDWPHSVSPPHRISTLCLGSKDILLY